MDFTLMETPTRHLVGVSIRTSHDQAPQDIPPFWHRVLSEQILSGVVSNAPGTIYAVYKEMEDAWHGAYTMMLAVEVEPDAATPEGFDRVEIKAARRACAQTANTQPETVMTAWHYIWNDWDQRGKRAYDVDLEIHRVQPDGSRTVAFNLSMTQAG